MNVLKRVLKFLLWILVLLFIVYVALIIFIRPSNDRDWSVDQAILPNVSKNGDLITIKNVRNFTYRTTSDYTPGYYDHIYDVSKLNKAYFMVEPFSGNSGAAHTFISFEFENRDRVVISVEIRKEKKEKFSALKGLLRQYELMYVIADEADVLKLRTNYRKDKVYLYPIMTSKEKIQALFNSMLDRAIELQNNPEFYNTITSTCTTNIVSHVNEITEEKISLDMRILLPANSDELAYERGFIDNSIPLEELRTKYYITDKAQKCDPKEDFGECVRR